MTLIDLNCQIQPPYDLITCLLLITPSHPLLAVGFTGYGLVLGQMSYWALVVITNLVTVLPFIGYDILFLLWGDSSVSSILLSRLFVVHFILPIIILLVMFVHLYLVHASTSYEDFVIATNRLELIAFYRSILIKDLLMLHLRHHVSLESSVSSSHLSHRVKDVTPGSSSHPQVESSISSSPCSPLLVARN